MKARNFLVVQWLGLGTFTAIDLGSNPSWGTKISQVAWHGQKKKETKKIKQSQCLKKKKREMKTYTHTQKKLCMQTITAAFFILAKSW